MAKKFDESKISRDKDGKFGKGGKGGTDRLKRVAKGKPSSEVSSEISDLKKEFDETIFTALKYGKDKEKVIKEFSEEARAGASEHEKGSADAEAWEDFLKHIEREKKSKNSLDLFHSKQYQTGKQRYGS